MSFTWWGASLGQIYYRKAGARLLEEIGKIKIQVISEASATFCQDSPEGRREEGLRGLLSDVGGKKTRNRYKKKAGIDGK